VTDSSSDVSAVISGLQHQHLRLRLTPTCYAALVAAAAAIASVSDSAISAAVSAVFVATEDRNSAICRYGDTIIKVLGVS
jgi:hypothetical protein